MLEGRAAAVRQRFEIPILVAAFAVIPVLLIEQSSESPGLLAAARLANWAIWLVFFSEYMLVVSLTRRKWAYTKSAWLDVFIILTSFPLWPSILAATRLARMLRLVRLFRVLRIGAVMSRGGAAARAIFKTRGLGYIIVITLLVAMAIGGLFAIFEESPVIDGIWWALVTVTTVGYGDIAPVTPMGRTVATILMLLGIGLVAVLTAAIAARFIEDDSGQELVDEVSRIHSRLDDLEQILLGSARDETG